MGLRTFDHEFSSDRCGNVLTEVSIAHRLTEPRVTVERVQISRVHVPQLNLRTNKSPFLNNKSPGAVMPLRFFGSSQLLILVQEMYVENPPEVAPTFY